MLDKTKPVWLSAIYVVGDLRCQTAQPERISLRKRTRLTTFDYSDFGLLSTGILFSCALYWAAVASVAVCPLSSMWFLANSSSVMSLIP